MRSREKNKQTRHHSFLSHKGTRYFWKESAGMENYKIKRYMPLFKPAITQDSVSKHLICFSTGVSLFWDKSRKFMDETIYRQLAAASKSQRQRLVLEGNFNYPDICCRTMTLKHEQPRRFLKSIDHSSLSWIVEDPTRNVVAV